MTTEIKNRQNTKEIILDAAIKLFSENGISGVSIRDITREVGIKESSLYNHYKSKDELLDAVLRKFMNEFGMKCFDLNTLESKLTDIDPEVFLQHTLLNVRENITETVYRMWRIVYLEQFRDKRARDFAVNEIMNRPLEYYKKAFSLMIEKGLIKEHDPELLADEFNYTLYALTVKWMLLLADNDQASAASIMRKMLGHIKFFCENLRI